MRVLDLFSGIGAHATGLHAAGGFRTVQFVESNPYRRQRLAAQFQGVPIHDDVRTYPGSPGEADVARDLACIGFHSARAEFAASDLGAPHTRRRVFIIANRSLPRLAFAWRRLPSEIAAFAGAGADRNPWATPFSGILGVDAGDARGHEREEIIGAIGDSNPPAMMEVIGRAIAAAQADGALP